MTFESFKNDLETKLTYLPKFELVEFHYLPYCFGNGLLVYRIGGQFHKFVFDGRDNELTWYMTRKKEKYETANFDFFKTFKGLIISDAILQELK